MTFLSTKFSNLRDAKSFIKLMNHLSLNNSAVHKLGHSTDFTISKIYLSDYRNFCWEQIELE
jgi:hypothetical protein